MAKKEPIGIILLNLGGPDSIQAVKLFLYNLFSDRKIIQLGPLFLQKPLAWLIAALRSKKTEGYYRLIGGKSPILDITAAQAKALEEALNQGLGVRGQGLENTNDENSSLVTRRSSLSFKVYVGMRYWHPLIEEIIPEICKDGIKKLIALSLYPQYSLATSGSSLSRLKEAASGYPIEIFCVPSWFNHPLYIEALADVIKKGLKSFSSSLVTRSAPGESAGADHSSLDDVHVLFSAHSLPQKFVDEGDPYVRQLKGTIDEIAKHMPLIWHLSYQSRSGPVKWLGPSTDEKLKELAGKNIKNILVVPISFVSDHIETLYEIDILYMQMAKDLGINLRRTDSLNTHPLFIEALKDLAIKNIKELGWIE